MSKFKIQIDSEPTSIHKIYMGTVTIDDSEYDYYLTDMDNNDKPTIEFLDDNNPEDELFDYEMKELLDEIEKQYKERLT